MHKGNYSCDSWFCQRYLVSRELILLRVTTLVVTDIVKGNYSRGNWFFHLFTQLTISPDLMLSWYDSTVFLLLFLSMWSVPLCSLRNCCERDHLREGNALGSIMKLDTLTCYRYYRYNVVFSLPSYHRLFVYHACCHRFPGFGQRSSEGWVLPLYGAFAQCGKPWCRNSDLLRILWVDGPWNWHLRWQ